jgi:hypothetical protein
MGEFCVDWKVKPGLASCCWLPVIPAKNALAIFFYTAKVVDRTLFRASCSIPIPSKIYNDLASYSFR